MTTTTTATSSATGLTPGKVSLKLVSTVPPNPLASKHDEEHHKVVAGPYQYLASKPGKDARKQLLHVLNHWMKVPEDRLAVIDKTIAMLHTSSLLIDDIEDSSDLRRGNPVAHSIFGIAQTINSANYVYFLALMELQKLQNPRLSQIFAEELVTLHRGQGMDLFWRDSLICPSFDEYIEMVSNKTGGLFRLAVRLMMAEGTGKSDLSDLATLIGVIFQIRDDYFNLTNSTYTKAKGLYEDLSEGKFSFPVIHAIQADPHNHVLLNILKQKSKDDAVKQYAVDYMGKMGSFTYCKAFINDLVQQAVCLIEGIQKCEQLGGQDKLLSEYVKKMML